ncbi:MAG: hypothetical protein B7Z44_02915 [Caulobacter sp. 12-67-6]|nr:MAG: hypothetical protein B7Z44_02915 [Caulobacter sp. 12-67-6]
MTAAIEDLVLGPRAISFCRVSRAGAAAANDDEHEEGSLLMTLRSVEAGDVLGWADIELDGQTTRLETRKARGLMLFAWGQTPVVEPMDVFVL